MWFVWAQPCHSQREALDGIAGVFSDRVIFPSVKRVGTSTPGLRLPPGPQRKEMQGAETRRPTAVQLKHKQEVTICFCKPLRCEAAYRMGKAGQSRNNPKAAVLGKVGFLRTAPLTGDFLPNDASQCDT